MSIIKKIIFLSIFIALISVSNTFAEDLKKVGKFKDWEVMIMSEAEIIEIKIDKNIIFLIMDMD